MGNIQNFLFKMAASEEGHADTEENNYITALTLV